MSLPDFIAGRTLWKHEGLLNRNWMDADPEDDDREPATEETANLVGSQVFADPHEHMPVLDIDFPAHLEPSTTPGHFHLYLNRAITWEQYMLLLAGLHLAGIIEEGFYMMSMKRGQSFVRVPGVKKLPGEEGSG